MNWEAYVDHVCNLIVKDGALGVEIVKNGLSAVQALSQKDFAKVFVILNSEWTDINKLVDDVKAEFAAALAN